METKRLSLRHLVAVKVSRDGQLEEPPSVPLLK
jgi:hypothetical protein